MNELVVLKCAGFLGGGLITGCLLAASCFLAGVCFAHVGDWVGAGAGHLASIFRRRAASKGGPRRLKVSAVAIVIFAAGASAASAEDVAPLYSLTADEFGELTAADPEWLAVELPADVRAWYRNPDGSCVQCSNGMIGVDQNVPAFSTLLWRSEYGPAERGGSNPSRVARYARERGVRIWNVTGAPTYDYMAWACRNGRGAAIGAGTRHFQTLMGHHPAARQWAVCNNNSTSRIDIYSDAGFHRLHESSGRWCVILDYPPHPATPRVREWWR